MKKILHVISSPRGEQSFSIKLGNAIIDKLKVENPGSEVKELNLVKLNFPHLEEAHLASFFTPEENRTDANKAAIRHSDESIKAIRDTDIIVIGAPLYNFGIHSTLKAWIDHIVRAGITFSYSDKGAEGLIKNKKVYLAIASGNVFSEGPLKAADFVEPYLRYILSFIGLSDITTVRVEGSAIAGLKEHALQKAIDSIAV